MTGRDSVRSSDTPSGGPPEGEAGGHDLGEATVIDWKPGTNWHDPAYLFDYFCDRYACEAMSYDQFRDAIRTAKRIVALGAFDDVEEVFDAAEERVWIQAELRKVYAEQGGRR